MFDLHVVQAEFGDCLIVSYGTARTSRTILIDGGPSGTYDAHLRGELRELLPDGRKLDLVILSHIDNDHVNGLLDLFSELEADAASPKDHPVDDRPPSVAMLWHNQFSVSAGGADIAPRIREALAMAAEGARRMVALGGTLMGVAEGDALAVAAMTLGVPINPGFPNGAVLVDDAPDVRLAGMRLEVLGPSNQILARLRADWLAWLKRHGRGPAGATGVAPAAAAAAAVAADGSLPNLSSIVVLVRARGRSMLLTGDGRGDQIVDGLRERSLLPAKGGVFHVDLLKVPHHGSARNTTEEFFRTVTADRYVISANGRYGNPDLECLVSLVDAAAGRPIEIICTNETDSLRQLKKDRPPKAHGYALTTMEPQAGVITVSLD